MSANRCFGLVPLVGLFLLLCTGCKQQVDGQNGPVTNSQPMTTAPTQKTLGKQAEIILLHHSTGQCIWDGGVAGWFDNHNDANGTKYQIAEQEFPKAEPYGWNNSPYDYWNIWVRHAGEKPYREEPTLEILTDKYDVVIFKHCFPVSKIEPDRGKADVASEEKRAENYKLQYAALKQKLREFPQTRFLIWTGAAEVEAELDEGQARRARQFFDWVKATWDEPGDNVYVWDFYELETEGGLYLKPVYSSGDAHPNEEFSKSVAPYLCQRIVDVVEGRGDTGPLTGRKAIGKKAPTTVDQPQPSPTAKAKPKPTSKQPVVQLTPGTWVFDDAEETRRKQLWGKAVSYQADAGGKVIRINFAEGVEEDWGEYGPHRIVSTTPPQQDWDIRTHRYVALRSKSDREMQVTLTLVTDGDRDDNSYFGFTAYVRLKGKEWQTFVFDLTKLELGAEGETAYKAAGEPARSNSLTYLKLAVHDKDSKAEFLIDDVAFYENLPEALKGLVASP